MTRFEFSFKAKLRRSFELLFCEPSELPPANDNTCFLKLKFSTFALRLPSTCTAKWFKNDFFDTDDPKFLYFLFVVYKLMATDLYYVSWKFMWSSDDNLFGTKFSFPLRKPLYEQSTPNMKLQQELAFIYSTRSNVIGLGSGFPLRQNILWLVPRGRRRVR